MSVAVLSRVAAASATTNISDLAESSLIDRAVAGDREAFGELYRRNRSDVHRTLRRLLRDFPADVDDVASQVFMTALEQIPSYQDRGRPFIAWLHTLTRFRAMEHRDWRRSRREDQLAAPDSRSGDLMAARCLSPENEAILRLELRRLLSSLPTRRRLALVLRDWAGWSYDEIARALKMSHRATDALVNNARKAAREAAASQQRLADRSTCECGCGQSVADSANGSRRFATRECWQWTVNERRRGAAAVQREAA